MDVDGWSGMAGWKDSKNKTGGARLLALPLLTRSSLDQSI